MQSLPSPYLLVWRRCGHICNYRRTLFCHTTFLNALPQAFKKARSYRRNTDITMFDDTFCRKGTRSTFLSPSSDQLSRIRWGSWISLSQGLKKRKQMLLFMCNMWSSVQTSMNMPNIFASKQRAFISRDAQIDRPIT